MVFEGRLEIVSKSGEFPIFVWWYKADRKYIEHSIAGLLYVITKIGMVENFPIYVLGEEFGVGAGSSEWYFENPHVRKRIFPKQYAAPDIIDLCEKEIWQEVPHIEFIVCGVDLYSGDKKNRFVFGGSRGLLNFSRRGGFIFNPYPAVILSHHRFLKPQNFFYMSMHESAHLFGIPADGRSDTEFVLGRHCRRVDCVASQTNVVRDIIFPDGHTEKRFISMQETYEYVNKRCEERGEYFCDECLRDFKQARRILEERFFV